MRKTYTLICLTLLMFFISACKPIDSPPEEINWLSLRGTFVEMDVDEKIDLIDPLEMKPGIRHLRTQGLLDMTISLNYLSNNITDDPVFISGAPVFLDFLIDYYADQTIDSQFYQYLRTSAALTDHEGHLLSIGQYTHVDFIMMYYDNFQSQYFSYNTFAYVGPYIYTLHDKQRKDYNTELTKSDFELDPISTLIEDLYQFIMENIVLFTNYMDVYDVRYGYRLEISFTLEDLLVMEYDIVDLIDPEKSDLETILMVDIYIAHDTMVLLKMDLDSFLIHLHASVDLYEYFGILLFDDYQIESLLNMKVFYHLYDEMPRLPEEDYLAIFRLVDNIILPRFDDFKIYEQVD